ASTDLSSTPSFFTIKLNKLPHQSQQINTIRPSKMSNIASNQPTQTVTSQQTSTPTTQQATQVTPAQGHGSRGGRAACVEGRYNLWRNSTVSEQEVAKVINQYLIDNGGESRSWCGVERQEVLNPSSFVACHPMLIVLYSVCSNLQVTGLEKKICEALAWQDQTGQGILDDVDEMAHQAGGDPNDSEDKDFVGNTITQTKAAIHKKCNYFFKLKPVMLDRPSTLWELMAVQPHLTTGASPSEVEMNYPLTLLRCQLELNVQLREVEIEQARAALEAQRALSAAMTQTRILQDFIQSGLKPAEALNMISHVFPLTLITAAGTHSQADLD
ncbi:hypothetical protein MJO29_012058, partial [Puccinia striiformis f. sp. tritici]